jgi:hypothetical protein
VGTRYSLEAVIRCGAGGWSVRGLGQIAKLGLQEIEIDRLGDELGGAILAGQALIVAMDGLQLLRDAAARSARDDGDRLACFLTKALAK